MIGNNNIEYRRKFSVNFLVVMLYEHIYWIDHVKTVEYKIAKKNCFTLPREPVSQ